MHEAVLDEFEPAILASVSLRAARSFASRSRSAFSRSEAAHVGVKHLGQPFRIYDALSDLADHNSVELVMRMRMPRQAIVPSFCFREQQ
jgi:hypothetical protein